MLINVDLDTRLPSVEVLQGLSAVLVEDDCQKSASEQPCATTELTAIALGSPFR